MSQTSLATDLSTHAAPRRVAVFRALQLGDMLCALPALRALRRGLPGSHITLIGLPWAREFAQRFDRNMDDFIEFPGAPGLPERIAEGDALERFYAEVQARAFDLMLQLHGDGRISNGIVQRLGAHAVAGFHPADGPSPDAKRFIPYPEGQPEIRRLLRLVSHVGIEACGEHLEFPIRSHEWKELSRLRLAYGLRPGDYVCVHPGARAADRRWPADRFAAVADLLAARGWRIVLTGSAAEATLTRAVARSMHAPALDLAGQTSVGVLAAVLTGARLLVCNDTGVSHIAAALSVPSVVICSASDPARWAPLDGERHRFVAGEGVSVSRVLEEAGRLV